MYSFFYNYYYYKSDIIKLIDEIDKDRKKLKSIKEPINSTFAEDLKMRLELLH
jgi:hypothetical protein